MLRITTVAVAAMLLGAPAANAQVIDLGRGGPQIDLRSNKQKDRDFRREQMRRDADLDRRSRYDRDMPTGSLRGRGGCREVTVRERDEYGRSVSRTRRDC